MPLSCIVHYKGQSNYSAIKELSDTNKIKICEAKIARENANAANQHTEQCSLIPDIFVEGKHGVHLTPCYKKFTYILSKASIESKSEPPRKSQRLSIDQDPSQRSPVLFPDTCFICSKKRIQIKKKDQYPVAITTLDAELTVKNAAKAKMPDFYYEIKDADLRAKELRFHSSCYKGFVRGFTKGEREMLSKEAMSITAITSSSDDFQQQGDFNAVKTYIDEHILRNKKAVSTSVLHELYGLHSEDTRYRSKLKQRILKEFGDQLSFVSLKYKAPEVVINSRATIGEIDFQDKTGCIIKAAKYLREDILSYFNDIPSTSWPPIHEELTANEGHIPENLIVFIKNVLYSSNEKNISESGDRIISSLASDLVYNAVHGKIITKKHYLLALGIHNITGQRKCVDILNRLGHCITYKQTCDIETALAVKSQTLAKQSNALPLIPSDDSKFVLTVFWVDNFDIKVERQTGSSSVNTTHLVAFQESTENTVKRNEEFSVPKNTKLLPLERIPNAQNLKFHSKPEPPVNLTLDDIATTALDSSIFIRYFNWIWLRNANSFDQQFPSFSGWQVNNRDHRDLKKTVLTYLPPINSKVNEFDTIITYMEYLQGLASDVNMPYVNVTLDVGAAMNAFKTLWSNHETFKNVVIHLGDFHFKKENFLVIGNLVAGSGWEDLVFQSGLSTSGSLKAVLSGSHYNRAWIQHSAVSEALERLLLKRYMFDCNITPNVIDEETSLKEVERKWDEYERYREGVRNGKIGKTPQFWVIYLDLMRMQQQIHTAIQENNYQLRLEAWEYFLPYYFAFDKTNYARYGSFYVQYLKALEKIHPGLKELLASKGLSVQSQEKYSLRTSIDQRGEQTINRDAKVAGGIKSFTTKEDNILKWCLNRSEQAKNKRALEDICNLTNDSGIYKPSRPSQILKSEKLTQDVISVLQEDYINPFGFSIDQKELVCISSGVPLKEEIAEPILAIRQVGEDKYQDFIRKTLVTKELSFHDAIKKNKIKTFKENQLKTITKSQKHIEVNRDMLSKILSISLKQERPLDLQKMLMYPLSEVPLSLSNADGTMRKTNKSKLSSILLSRQNQEMPPPLEKKKSAFVVDFMALIRTISPVPDTFEDLAMQIIGLLPKGFSRVDLVADSYFEISIKQQERAKRGKSQIILINSMKSKIPRDFSLFLGNGDNKSRMIDVIFECYQRKRIEILDILKTNEVLMSSYQKCVSLTRPSVLPVEDLQSNHEEADTKVICHALNYIQRQESNSVIIRSPSGDTDILVLAISHFTENKKKVRIDNGSGKSRSTVWLGNIDLSIERVETIIGFHSFTGNDYLSSFFKKGKEKSWKLIEKYRKFEDCFRNLGKSTELSQTDLDKLEEFVCYLYGAPLTQVNEARDMLLTFLEHCLEETYSDLTRQILN